MNTPRSLPTDLNWPLDNRCLFCYASSMLNNTTDNATTSRPMTRQEARRWHEDWADRDGTIEELDAQFHDHLPEGANCWWCGIEHAAINPENL